MDNKIDLTTLVANTEFATNISQFKILFEFLSNVMIYKYQNPNLGTDELNQICDKVDQFCKIIDTYLPKTPTE